MDHGHMISKLKDIFSILVILIFVAIVPEIRADSIPETFSIIEPGANSLFEDELIDLVVKVNDAGIDTLVVLNNDNEIWKSPVIKGKAFYCKTLKLDYGPNDLTVNAVKSGKVIESKKALVFYRADVSKKFRKAPPEFEKKAFHQGSREAACNPCHKVELSEKDLNPLRPENSMCYQCHRKIADYKYVHGPTARGDCFKCHEKDSKPVKFATMKPDRELCYTCHKEKKAEWTPKQYVHGPTATGKCTICHNPHASDNNAWLRKPAWDLCITCHEDRGSGAHVVVGFIPGSTHPTRGKPDPMHYGKELSCASCHSPHASDSKSLFPNDAQTFDGLCQMCHKK